jgi:hypothetical protein
MHHDCQECTRLWSEYALVTRHYLKLEGRLQIAEISHDQRTIEELKPMVQTALDERADVRRRIEHHEAQPRAGAASA